MAGRRPVARSVLAVVATATTVLGSAAGAGAATGPTDGQIDEAEEQIEQLDQSIQDTETRTAELENRLQQLDVRLAAAAAQLADAEERTAVADREADLAAAEVARTETELSAARAQLAENREQLDDAARTAWMRGGTVLSPTLAVVGSLGNGADVSDAAEAAQLMGFVVGGRSVAVSDTRVLLTRTEQLERSVRAAEVDATARFDEASRARDDAAARSAEVLALVDEADAAVREQRDAAARLEAERAAASEDLEQLEQDRERAIAAAEDAVGSRPVADGLVSVGGITVAASIAPAVEDLLEAAYSDGIVLTGYGYRSPETTARLRLANGCPDVYESPASACRVPTARPGESMHEQGLAIDFNYQGRTICYPRSALSCVDNPAFDWLSENAGRYGLRVLSTEAWHWSTNGQ